MGQWAFCLAFAFWLLNKYRSQKKKWLKPSLFFPHFDFTLMNVNMNTGIK